MKKNTLYFGIFLKSSRKVAFPVMLNPTALRTAYQLMAVSGAIGLIPKSVLNWQAKGKERQWLKNQTYGDLDDAKLIDGLTGEKSVYKRRGEKEPEVKSL